MSIPIIKTTGLTYGYSNDDKILFDINMTVERGSIYGFLGPNGSGKTTTLSLLLGLLQGADGEIQIFGESILANRMDILRKIGSLIETPSLYGHLSAKENLQIYRNIYGVDRSRINEVLQLVELDDTGSKPARRFSLGMKQRLAVALALLPNPELLILDEPTNGLDPSGIIELRELIKRLNKDNGITILVSSHILSEVEKMVSHVGIIFRGRMLFEGSLSDLRKLQPKESTLLINTSNNDLAFNLLRDLKPEKKYGNLSVNFSDNSQLATISRRLFVNDLDVYMLNPITHDLEQLYIDLTTKHV